MTIRELESQNAFLVENHALIWTQVMYNNYYGLEKFRKISIDLGYISDSINPNTEFSVAQFEGANPPH